MISILESYPQGDAIIPENIKHVFQQEENKSNSEKNALYSLQKLAQSKYHTSQKYASNIDILLNSYHKSIKEPSERKDNLIKSDLLKQIQTIEQTLDTKLAHLFAKSVVLDHQNNTIHCFGFVQLGKNIFMMAKSHIILNYETFIRQFLNQMSTDFIRKFTISNYAVLVKPKYLEMLIKKYHPRKTFKLDEDHTRHKMINEFSNRFGFLVQLYRNKIDSVESLHRNKIVQGFTMFFHNGFLEIKNRAKNLTLEVLKEFLTGKIHRYIVSIIPFISQIRFLKTILMMLIKIIIEIIIKQLVAGFKLAAPLVKQIMQPTLEFIRKSFNNQVESIYLDQFFQDFDWMNSITTAERSNYDIESKIYLEDDLNMSDTSDQEVFTVLKVNRIQDQYQKVIGNYAKDMPVNQIQIFDQHKYYLSFKLFKNNSYLYDLARMQKEINDTQSDIRRIIL